MKQLSLIILVLSLSFAALPRSEATTTCIGYHIVQRGDTLSSIARSYSVTVSQLTTWNSLSNPNVIKAGQNICVRVSEATNRSHTVKRGETLYSIARAYGVNVTVLAQVNGITNLNRIYVGQVLRIPDVTIQ